MSGTTGSGSTSPQGYEILRELGTGASATVYLARDLKHDREVALKVVRHDLAVAPTRFLAEIRTLAKLQHPHILPLHDSGLWEGTPFFAMPYLRGETLRDRIARTGAQPLATAVAITRQVADALEHAHRQGIVHRDIKPANILLADDHAYIADFGIAHVINAATSDSATSSGVAVGTPAYMSPEQAAGERNLDGRSDIYSLGCVCYEMLTGERPFRGTVASVIMTRRLTERPPGVRLLRPSVPEALAKVIECTLEPTPGDRYQHAADLVKALDTVDAGHPHHSSRSRILATAGAVAAVVAAFAWYLTTREGAAHELSLDQTAYAVFPFRHVNGASSMGLDGDNCARRLHDALARWEGPRLVDDMRVSDVWQRRKPRTVDQVLDAARSLRARWATWGEVVSSGDSLEIRVVRYDASGQDAATRQFVARVGHDGSQYDRTFAALAESLVVSGERRRDGTTLHTFNKDAADRYYEARVAIDSFDLTRAEEHLGDAVRIDPGFAQAQLLLARTMAWRGVDDPATWRVHAAYAARDSALTAREREHAVALLDLAEGRMPEACRRYRRLTASDTLEFAAWFGLGDCNARDDAVVRDVRSPTGFSFRGSFHTAIAAYRHALSIAPSFQQVERGLAFKRLSERVLYTEESRLRRGYAIAPDTQHFAAFPSFDAETLAFVALPYKVAVEGPPPATERRAVIWSNDVNRRLMEQWATAFPESGDAQERFSNALEASGAIEGVDHTLPAALRAAREAARRSLDGDEAVRRQATIVRLLLKSDSVAAAKAAADSLLAAMAAPTPRSAGHLAGLAALTGRADRAAALLRIAASDSAFVPFASQAGGRGRIPVEVTAAALELLAYASMGGPRDSVRTTFLRATGLVDAWVPAGERAEVRRTLFHNAFSLAYDDLAPLATFTVDPGSNLVLAMRQAMARQDSSSARRASAKLAAATAKYAPGTMGIDRIDRHARALLLLGDSTAAIAQLDAGLGALPRSRSILVSVVPQAGSIVPAMALRAELAWRRGDRATFERWARPVVLLWRDADPPLQATIATIRERASTPR
ncbi:MAG TPA: protein kinase [Gemmatimonadaceae bacterium]|nr:protein kinase [Gemmatimonadaceae bacterium]